MANGLQILERRAFSIVEAAQMCGVSRATVYKLIEQNKLETVKIGSRRLVGPTPRDRRPSERGRSNFVRSLRWPTKMR
jgi:excisionase family DNA binding protein